MPSLSRDSYVDFLTSNNNLFILAIAAVSGLMLIWPTINRSRSGNAVNSTQAVQMINQRHAIVIDVRPADQFAAGHIAQARNIPLDELEQKAAALPKNKPLIIVCDMGRHAGRAAAKFKSLGHADVAMLEGGLRAWTQGGLPLTRKKS